MILLNQTRQLAMDQLVLPPDLTICNLFCSFLLSHFPVVPPGLQFSAHYSILGPLLVPTLPRLTEHSKGDVFPLTVDARVAMQ